MVSVGTAIESEQTDPSEAVAPDKYGLSDKQHVMNEKDLTNVLSMISLMYSVMGEIEGSCFTSNSRIIFPNWELIMKDHSPCLMKRNPGSIIPPTLHSVA